MLITLLKTCILGRSGTIVNVTVYKANELMRLKLASEYIPELERKVVKPLIKEVSTEVKKRGRPRKVQNESN